MGIVRALRDIFRQTRTFGDKARDTFSSTVISCPWLRRSIKRVVCGAGCSQELAQIRTAAESLKAEVDFLKQEQAKSRAQEEALVLRELRRTVTAVHAERDTIRQQAAAVGLC